MREVGHVDKLFSAFISNCLRQNCVAFKRFEHESFRRELGVHFATFDVFEHSPRCPEGHASALFPPFSFHVERILIESTMYINVLN